MCYGHTKNVSPAIGLLSIQVPAKRPTFLQATNASSFCDGLNYVLACKGLGAQKELGRFGEGYLRQVFVTESLANQSRMNVCACLSLFWILKLNQNIC